MKKNSLLIVILTICSVTFSCQKEDGNNEESLFSSEIINSNEFKEFIIAGANVKKSLEIFKEELSKINFYNLETVYDSNGNKITHLPPSIQELNLEKKILHLNITKKDLISKFPQLKTISSSRFIEYANKCIETIKDDPSSLTKSTTELSFDNTTELVGYLYNWTLSPDYVEVAIYFFGDGTSLVVLDSANTQNSCVISFTTYGHAHFYNGKHIVSVSHTHRDSFQPSDADKAILDSMPYCSHSIFYSGSFYYYY